MYKTITNTRDADDLSIGFDRDRGRRQRKLINTKNRKGKHHATIMLGDIFGFAEHQEKATQVLGLKLTITRISGNSVLNKANATHNAKFKINGFEWYLPLYAPSMDQQKIIS